MNYLDIILQGYFDNNKRPFLEKYFLREFKKAEKNELLEADEFFNGCINVVNDWETHLNKMLFDRKVELLKIYSITRDITIKQEAEGLKIEDFKLNLISLTKGKVIYNISLNEIVQIQYAILKGFEKTKNPAPQQAEKPKPKPKPKLTINQIALTYAYSEIQITRENGNEIAKEYGHNSGEKLFQRFTFYSSSANRKGKPQLCTPKKLKNKIELLESVFEHLPKNKRNRIKDEIKILKNIQEAEYQ